MTEQALSPDTDKRFVETVIARRLVDAETVARLSGEHERDLALGLSTGSLAEYLCAKGLLDRRRAAEILREIRSERGRDSTWPNEKGPAEKGASEPDSGSDEGVLPRKVGDYVLERELGRGGMGSVWLGRNEKTGATRAVKLLDGIGDAERVARFRLEAEALARVGGDIVVPVHEIGVARGRIYFVMGVMSGGSLRTRLKEHGAYPWREAARIAAQVARALERCHAVGLIHRDLKPDNVLLDTGGRPHIADFGVARDLTGASLTETGTVLGTPVYMPPEQLQGLKVDARADVYALGALLHELISGSRPFSGTSIYEVFEAKKSSSSEPLPPDTPADLAALIARAMAPEPGARQSSARELAEDLERLLAASPSKTTGGAPRRIKVLGAVLAAACAVLAIEVAIFVLAPRRGVPPVPPSPPPGPPAPVAPTGPTAGERIAAANRELVMAAAHIGSGSVDQAALCVERARKASPGSVPTDGLRLVNEAIQKRLAAIATVDPHVGAHLAKPYHELRVLKEIGDALGSPIPMTRDSLTVVSAYHHWRKNQRPPDWEGALEAGHLLLDYVPEVAEEVAGWARNAASDLRKDTPPVARALIDRTCDVAPAIARSECRLRRVQFFGLVGDKVAMVAAATEVLAADRSPDVAASVLRAVDLARFETDLAPDQLDALVEASGGAAELVLLRGRYDPARREDIAVALAAGLRDAPYRESAADIVVAHASLRRRFLELAFEKGDLELAGWVLSRSSNEPIRALAAEARAARSPAEQKAFIERLDGLR